MNEEIVRLLEREYPAPFPIQRRVKEILKLAALLKVDVNDETLFGLTATLYDTVNAIASGQAKGVSDEARELIREALAQYLQDQGEENHSDYEAKLDDAERTVFERMGHTGKFVDPEFPE